MTKHDLLMKIAVKTGFFLHRVEKIDLFEMLMLKYINNNFSFVQIGANDGHSYDPLEKYIKLFNLTGLMVEPDSISFDKLADKYGNVNEIMLRKVAVTEKGGKVKLYKPDLRSPRAPAYANGIASLDASHVKKSGLLDSDIIIEEVDSVNINELVRDAKLEDAKLLIVDAEGSDYEIIRSIDFNTFNPNVILFEHGREDNVMEAWQMEELMNVLMAQSYKIQILDYDCIAYK